MTSTNSLETVESFLGEPLSAETVKRLASAPARQKRELLLRVHHERRFWTMYRRHRLRRSLATRPDTSVVRALKRPGGETTAIELASGYVNFSDLKRQVLYCPQLTLNDPLSTFVDLLDRFVVSHSGHGFSSGKVSYSSACAQISGLDQWFRDALMLLLLVKPVVESGEFLLMPTHTVMDSSVNRVFDIMSALYPDVEMSDTAYELQKQLGGYQAFMGPQANLDAVIKEFAILGPIYAFADLQLRSVTLRPEGIIREALRPSHWSLTKSALRFDKSRERAALRFGLPAAEGLGLSDVITLRASDQFTDFRSTYADLISRMSSISTDNATTFRSEFSEMAQDLLASRVEALNVVANEKSVWRDILRPGAISLGAGLFDLTVLKQPSVGSLVATYQAVQIGRRINRDRDHASAASSMLLTLMDSGPAKVTDFATVDPSVSSTMLLASV